ncbi:LysR family transcriptional regulator [uncultured Vibrio sp.]|uniref:LysR family transcriptional regulator n=1 Tax=uncultured Vibrio sp. TaxID=114054 RepID=UPI0025E33BB8|nr:LysR family transcriptional regulator [uncultured Vibrio sp.]
MKRFNLNLIYYFIAIYEEGTLTNAAERLNISQPSLSAHLKQLREVYNDLLFVRKAHSLEPTKCANELYPILKQTYRLVTDSLPDTSNFDPQECHDTFRIASMSISSSIILPVVMEKIQQKAPNCVIEVVNIKSDILTDIRDKKIDLIINASDAYPTLLSKPVWEGDVCVICSQDHPSIKDDISVSEYLSHKHVMLTHDEQAMPPLSERQSPVFAQRKVARKLNNIADICTTINNSHWLATIPTSLVDAYGYAQKVKQLTLPFDYKTPSISLFWHNNRHHDTVNKWLRNLF